MTPPPIDNSATAGPLVIKIGGSTLDDHLGNQSLWRAIASLIDSKATGRRSAGVILVHGGGKAVDRQLARLGIVSERRQGLRITPPEQMPDVVGVLAGSVNKALVGSLLVAGAQPVGLCLGDGAMLQCSKSDPPGVDLGRVGAVDGGQARLLKVLTTEGFLPVVSSIGIDAQGETLNLNADDAAAGIAEAIHASALVLLTDVPGIKDRAGVIRSEVTPGAVEAMIASGEITGGMIPKSRAASGVVIRAGIPVVILSGEDPTHLINWIGGQIVGTSIVPDAMTAEITLKARSSAPSH